MIYYNNKKIAKAYYGLRNGRYIGTAHIKNYSEETVHLTILKKSNLDNSVISGADRVYVLDGGAVYTFSTDEFVDNDYRYTLEWNYKTTPWSSINTGKVITLGTSEKYYKLSNLSRIEAPSSSFISDTKPLDWDNTIDSTTLPFKQKITLTTNPEHWSSSVDFKLIVYYINTNTNKLVEVKSVKGTVSTTTPRTISLTFDATNRVYLISTANTLKGGTTYYSNNEFYHYIVGNTVNTIDISNFGGQQNDVVVTYGFDETLVS